jgi:Immunity protein 50
VWFEHIRNGQAVSSVFGGEIPTLEGLVLEQVIVNAPGELAIALNLECLPSSIPTRWREKGYDRLQFRMRYFGIDDLTIRQQPGTTSSKVSVGLEKGRLRMASIDGSFEVISNFADALLEFYPYRSKEFEFPPRWYHQ